MNPIHTLLFIGLMSLGSHSFGQAPSQTRPSLGFDAALKLATETRLACQRMGFSVAVSVVDRQALPLVLLVSDDAFAHARKTSERKARTAASRRASTGDILGGNDHEQSLGVAFHAIGLTTLSGGLPVVHDNQYVGGVGVAGAPGQNALGQDFDTLCAEAGIKSIGAQWAAAKGTKE